MIAGAVGVAAYHPGAAGAAPGQGPSRSVRALAAQAGLAVALMGAVNAIATLAGCLPAVIWWACHRPNRVWWRYTAWWLLALSLAMLWWIVALASLRSVSPLFLDFIEFLRRDNEMVVVGGDTARHRKLDPVRGTDRHGGRAAGDRISGHPGHLPGRGGRTGRVGQPSDAGSGTADDDAVGRRGADGFVGYSGGLGSLLAHSGAIVLRRRRCTPAQHAQAGLGDPDPSGAGHLRRPLGRIPLPGSVPVSVWLPAFAHPERDKRVGRGDSGDRDRAGGQHLVGVDRSADPTGHVQRDTPVLA